MEENTSKVYIRVDEQDRILRCEGGYTMGNIDNVEEWLLIDEGNGDKYNLCQSHYFDGGLYTEDGICRYKWTGRSAVERSEEEIAADRAAREQAKYPAKRVAELKQLLADSDYAVIKIAEGAADREEYEELIAQRQAWREEINSLEN